MTYDYMANMIIDIKRVYKEYDYSGCSDMDDVAELLDDELWARDSVTGNGSASCYFDDERSRDCICGNEDLLVDAIQSYGNELDDYKRALTEPAFADVIIRCYLLNQAIWETLEDPSVKRYIESQMNGGSRSCNRKSKTKKAPVRR